MFTVIKQHCVIQETGTAVPVFLMFIVPTDLQLAYWH